MIKSKVELPLPICGKGISIIAQSLPILQAFNFITLFSFVDFTCLFEKKFGKELYC